MWVCPFCGGGWGFMWPWGGGALGWMFGVLWIVLWVVVVAAAVYFVYKLFAGMMGERGSRREEEELREEIRRLRRELRKLREETKRREGES
ncbi:MAG: hypothetical protein ABWW70_00200 [Thermoproteota archaeon]